MFKFWPVLLLSTAATLSAYSYATYRPQLDASRKQLETVVEIATGVASRRQPTVLEAIASPAPERREYALVEDAPAVPKPASLASKIVVSRAPKVEIDEHAVAVSTPQPAKITEPPLLTVKSSLAPADTRRAADLSVSERPVGGPAVIEKPSAAPMRRQNMAKLGGPTAPSTKSAPSSKSAKAAASSTRRAAQPAAVAAQRKPQDGWSRRVFAQLEQGAR